MMLSSVSSLLESVSSSSVPVTNPPASCSRSFFVLSLLPVSCSKWGRVGHCQRDHSLVCLAVGTSVVPYNTCGSRPASLSAGVVCCSVGAFAVVVTRLFVPSHMLSPSLVLLCPAFFGHLRSRCSSRCLASHRFIALFTSQACGVLKGSFLHLVDSSCSQELSLHSHLSFVSRVSSVFLCSLPCPAEGACWNQRSRGFVYTT